MNNYEYSRTSRRSNTDSHRGGAGAADEKTHYSAPRLVKNVWGQSQNQGQAQHTPSLSSAIDNGFSSSPHETTTHRSRNSSVVRNQPFLYTEPPSHHRHVIITPGSSTGYAAAVLNTATTSPKKVSSSQLSANASEFVMPGTVQESTSTPNVATTERSAWSVPRGPGTGTGIGTRTGIAIGTANKQRPYVSYSQQANQKVSHGAHTTSTKNKKKGSQQNQPSTKSKKPKTRPQTLGGLVDLTLHQPNSSLRILKNAHPPIVQSKRKDNQRSTTPLTGLSGLEDFPSLPPSDTTHRINTQRNVNVIHSFATPQPIRQTKSRTTTQKIPMSTPPGSSKKSSKPKGLKATMSASKPSHSSNFFFSPNPSTPTSALFDYHSDNMLKMGVATKKGLRKVGPRKKRLTSLKKRILQERLLQYRKANGLDVVLDKDSHVDVSENVPEPSISKTIVLDNFVTSEEVEDDEEHEEILVDLSDMANKVGPILGTFIPRPDQDPLDIQGLAFVRFEKLEDSLAAKACWDNMIVGGNMIEVATVPTLVLGNDNDLNWLHEVQQLSKKSLFKNGIETASQTMNKPVTKMTLSNVLTEDDYEDEDFLNETLSDIFSLAGKYGELVMNKCFAETTGPLKGNIYICFEGDCGNASDLDGLMLGGQHISASFDHQSTEHESPLIVHLENILNDADYEDHECLEETLEDIKQLASRYGVFESIHIELEDEECRGRVSITYTFKHDALDAAKHFDGMVIGGETIKAYLTISSSNELSATQSLPQTPPTLVLSNILSDDDFEDEDCLEETKQDVLVLVEKFGKVRELIVKVDGTDRGNIIIEFDSSNDKAVPRAIDELDGALFGGAKISASMPRKGNESNDQKREEPKKEESLAPLYSGGKIIPEQYAACKRVPKIPNAGIPRDYAKRIPDESTVPLLFEMLGELMRLQQRAKDDKNAKARRRLVIGLREVARGIRSHKVKMVIMANNVDEYGALDTKLQDILTLANEEDVPIIFELNKRKLGKALGKNIKISVVGIQNADGAYETFKKLKKLSLLAR